MAILILGTLAFFALAKILITTVHQVVYSVDTLTRWGRESAAVSR